MLLSCRGWTWKNSWRTAMADSAIDWEVIIVANRCVYRKKVLDEKCLFYFHVNGSIGIVQKIEFKIRLDLGCTVQPSKRREKWFRTTRLWVCLSVCLSVCMSACLSICLSSCLSGSLSVCLCVCLSECLSVILSVCHSVCLSVCISVCLCFCLSVCLSFCLSIYLSVCLAVSFSANSHGRRVNRSSWNFRGNGYIWHCVVSIFEAIRLPVYKII